MKQYFFVTHQNAENDHNQNCKHSTTAFSRITECPPKKRYLDNEFNAPSSLFNVQPTLDFVESKVPVSLTSPGALDASRAGTDLGSRVFAEPTPRVAIDLEYQGFMNPRVNSLDPESFK